MASTRRTALGPNGASFKYIDHPELHDTGQLHSLLEEASAIVMRSSGYSPATETTLFRALQACAHALGSATARTKRGPRSKSWLAALHRQIADRLVHENTGLVYDMLRFSGVSDRDSDELHSEGFWTLFRAVASFNPWLGFRFSTYACTSLRRAYRLVLRRKQREKEELARIFVEAEAAKPIASDRRTLDAEVLADRVRVTLRENKADLSPAERYIIEKRLLHTPGSKAATLSVLATEFKLSKERVRQIQLAALRKLREALQEDELLVIGPQPMETPVETEIAPITGAESEPAETTVGEPTTILAA